MSPLLVALCYGAALALALFLLQHFGAKHWYWHVLAIAAGLIVGLTPLPPLLNTPVGTIAIGCAFFFLMVWGVGAIFFVIGGHHPHLGHHTR